MRSHSKRALVILALAVCVFGTWLNGSLQPRALARPTEIYNVVCNQIHALRRADYPSAYRQVSATFQDRFSPEAFPDLLRTEYPEVLRADRVEFGAVQSNSHRALVQVYFIFPEGHVVPCTYSLVNEDSAWKIDGTRIDRRAKTQQRLGGVRL